MNIRRIFVTLFPVVALAACNTEDERNASLDGDQQVEISEDDRNPTTHTVAFNVPDYFERVGGGALTQTVDHGEDAEPPVLDSESHRFDSWSTPLKNIRRTTSVTVNSTINTYEVEFVADPDGKVTIEDGPRQRQFVPHGSNAEPPDIQMPEPPLYDFVEWSDPITAVTGPMTLYPVIKRRTDLETFEVAFDLGSFFVPASGSDAELVNQEIEEFSSAVPPQVSSDTHVFTGWDSDDYVEVASDVTISPLFEPKVFTIVFDISGHPDLSFGAFGPDPVQEVEYGGRAEPPDIEPDDPMLFSGWDTDFNFITGDMVIRPDEIEDPVVVEFRLGEEGEADVLTYVGGPSLTQAMAEGDTPSEPGVYAPEFDVLTWRRSDVDNNCEPPEGEDEISFSECGFGLLPAENDAGDPNVYYPVLEAVDEDLETYTVTFEVPGQFQHDADSPDLVQTIPEGRNALPPQLTADVPYQVFLWWGDTGAEFMDVQDDLTLSATTEELREPGPVEVKPVGPYLEITWGGTANADRYQVFAGPEEFEATEEGITEFLQSGGRPESIDSEEDFNVRWDIDEIDETYFVVVAPVIQRAGMNFRGELSDRIEVIAIYPEAGRPVSVGRDHGCLGDEDEIYCWGSNTSERFDSQVTEYSSPTDVPELADSFNGGNLQAISAMNTTLCLVSDAPEVYCFGDSGSLFSGAESRMASGSDILSIVQGHDHLVLLGHADGDRSVYTGGDNVFAQMLRFTDETQFQAATSQEGLPVDSIPGDAYVVSDPITEEIYAGPATTCLLNVDGEVVCGGAPVWSGDDAETLMNQDPVMPTKLEDIGTPVRDVAVGEDFMCVLTDDREILCRGNNLRGAVTGVVPDAGDPDNEAPESVTEWHALENHTQPDRPFNNMVRLQAGAGYACAVSRRGLGYCWGDNSHGQLGIPLTPPEYNMHILTLGNEDRVVIDFRLGDRTGCMVDNEADIYCWGDNTASAAGVVDEGVSPSSVEQPTRLDW